MVGSPGCGRRVEAGGAGYRPGRAGTPVSLARPGLLPVRSWSCSDSWGDLCRGKGDVCGSGVAAGLASEVPPQALLGSFPVPETQPRLTLMIWRVGSCAENWFSARAACQNHLESFFNNRCLAPPPDLLNQKLRRWHQGSCGRKSPPVDSWAQLV